MKKDINKKSLNKEEINKEIKTDKDIQYYAVYYSKDGKIMLFPGNDKQDCLNKMDIMLEDKRYFNLCKATTVIKRDMSNFEDGLLFGNPKSLNAKERIKS